MRIFFEKQFPPFPPRIWTMAQIRCSLLLEKLHRPALSPGIGERPSRFLSSPQSRPFPWTMDGFVKCHFCLLNKPTMTLLGSRSRLLVTMLGSHLFSSQSNSKPSFRLLVQSPSSTGSGLPAWPCDKPAVKWVSGKILDLNSARTDAPDTTTGEIPRPPPPPSTDPAPRSVYTEAMIIRDLVQLLLGDSCSECAKR